MTLTAGTDDKSTPEAPLRTADPPETLNSGLISGGIRLSFRGSTHNTDITRYTQSGYQRPNSARPKTSKSFFVSVIENTEGIGAQADI